MTIHSGHPFVPPPHERNGVRRLRGRLPAPVTLWTAVGSAGPAAWTVSSLLVVDGEPPEALGLLKEDSDLWDAAAESGLVAVSLLQAGHEVLADAAAEVGPAPGGIWRLVEFTQTQWGPVVTGCSWFGLRLSPAPSPEPVGWNVLVRGVIEHVHLADGETLGTLRGRYHHWPAGT